MAQLFSAAVRWPAGVCRQTVQELHVATEAFSLEAAAAELQGEGGEALCKAKASQQGLALHNAGQQLRCRALKLTTPDLSPVQISCPAGSADIDDLVRQRQAAHVALFCEAQKAMQAGMEAQETLQQLLKTWVQRGRLHCMFPRCTLVTCLLCHLAPGMPPCAEHSPRRVSLQSC